MPFGKQRWKKLNVEKQKQEEDEVGNGDAVGVDKRHEVDEGSQTQVALG